MSEKDKKEKNTKEKSENNKEKNKKTNYLTISEKVFIYKQAQWVYSVRNFKTHTDTYRRKHDGYEKRFAYRLYSAWTVPAGV